MKEKKIEEERKLMILKEKEKELKLNELKIKELRRLVKYNGSSINNTSNIDMREYRHKRNIKYMDR